MMDLNEQIRHFEEVMLPAIENKQKSHRTAILPEYSFFIALKNDDKLISTYHSQLQVNSSSLLLLLHYYYYYYYYYFVLKIGPLLLFLCFTVFAASICCRNIKKK